MLLKKYCLNEIMVSLIRVDLRQNEVSAASAEEAPTGTRVAWNRNYPHLKCNRDSPNHFIFHRYY